jgi:hypothetical protein
MGWDDTFKRATSLTGILDPGGFITGDNILNDYTIQEMLRDYAKKHQGVISDIGSKLPTSPVQSQSLTGAQNRHSQVMSDDYNALDVDKVYNKRRTDLYKDVINPEDDNLMSKLALSGQVSSNRGDNSGQNQRLMSGMKNNLQNLNLSQTMTDKNTAFNLSPSLYDIETTNQRYPLNAWMNYANLISNGIAGMTGAAKVGMENSAAAGQGAGAIASMIQNINKNKNQTNGA